MGKNNKMKVTLIVLALVVCASFVIGQEDDKELVPINVLPIAFHADTVVLNGDHAVNISAGGVVNIGEETPLVQIHSDAELRVPFSKGGSSLAGTKCAAEGIMRHNVPGDGYPPEVCFCVLDDTTLRTT